MKLKNFLKRKKNTKSQPPNLPNPFSQDQGNIGDVKTKNKRKLFSKFKIGRISKRQKKMLSVSVLLTVVVATISSIILTDGEVIREIIHFLQNVDFDHYLIFLAILFLGTLLFDLIFIIGNIRFKKKFKFFQRKIILVVVNALFIILFATVIFFAYFRKHPLLIETFPIEETHLESYEQRLKVRFNVPVRTDKLKPSVTPAIDGNWIWKPYLGSNALTREGYFEIKETPYLDGRFVAYIAGINKLSDSIEHEYGFVFFSVKSPEIVASYPTPDLASVPRNSEISIDYSGSVSDVMDVSITISPEIEFETQINKNNITIIPTNDLQQGGNYTVSINKNPIRKNMQTGEIIERLESLEPDTISFTVVKAPHIASFNPSGDYVLVNSKINVVFEEPMSKSSVQKSMRIEPEIEYNLNWLSETELEIELSNLLEKDTRYNIIFDTNLKSNAGGIIEEEIVNSFKTIGKVKVAEFAPSAEASYVNEYSSIRVRFDQAVNHESAQAHFSISPGVGGNFSWEENVMIFTPNAPLTLGTGYTINVSPGIESIDGLTSEDAYVSNFYTRPNEVTIWVPMYYQSRSFSCNINTARMILALKGVGVPSEDSLIAEIGYNSNQSNGNWTGNPYSEFIGTADGNYGYGVYWPPIQGVLSRRGIHTEVRQGWDVVGLAYEVQAGHPVIVWRYNGVGGGQNISWTSSDGTYVYAYNGMHGSVVTGFLGPADNPTHFRVNDPWLGQFWLGRDTFDWYWSFSGRIGLVVY